MAFQIDYADLQRLVPTHLRPGLRRYFEEGTRPGGALSAILSNAPASVVIMAADDEVRTRLLDIFHFLHGYAPPGSWGTSEAFEAWIAGGGLKGKAA